MSSRNSLLPRVRAPRVCGIAVVAMFGGWLIPPAQAETLARQRSQAEELVSEALAQEVYGRGIERQQLLARAVELCPEQPAGHWHQGQVRVGNRWLSVTDAIETDRQRRLRETYEQRRSAAADTADGQLALADWCAEHGLTSQEAAHLNHILQLAPDHAAARQRLHFQRVNGAWVRGQDLSQGLQQDQQTAESMRKWQRKLEELRRGLRRNAPALTAQLIEKCKTDLTADAVPALEILFGNDSEDAAQVGVELLGSIRGDKAALALARQSVLSVWPEVRRAAAEQLQTRPRDHYVPHMLAEMSTSIESQYQAVLENGRIRYRHEFVRETQDQRKAVVLDTVMDRRTSAAATLPGDPASGSPEPPQGVTRVQAEARMRALADAQVSAYVREWQRMRQNESIEALNERICEALRVATGQSLPSSPDAWWSWWNSENEVALMGSKPTELTYQQQSQTYEDIQSGGGSSPPPPRAECFVAGTPVWTVAGPVAIECVRVGDLVLSQDPETGELAYQPVLQTSERPPELLLKICLATQNSGTLEGSGGHPLWAAGHGWVKLRDVKSGMVLHGVDGPTLVSDVVETRTEQTFNLVVAEFHTYVVGGPRILCHDNTPRRATNALVPGLRPR